MTHAAYFDWLMRVAMGWLAWDEETALDTRMTSIVLAYEGRCEMLKAIFGSGEAEPPKDKVSAKVTDAKAMQKVFDAIG